MDYNPESDTCICKNGRRLNADHIRFSKTKTGYVSEKRFLNVRTTADVRTKETVSKATIVKQRCKKGQRHSRPPNIFEVQCGRNLERIFSDEGILYKINRSIQAEGSFGDGKQDMLFRRYLIRGASNVLAEIILPAMLLNINKLHNKF